MANKNILITCLGKGQEVTLTAASPCIVTYGSHGMRAGHPIVFEGNGDTLPTGLTHGVTYYVVSTTTDTVTLSATEGGVEINTSGTQAGTHILVGDYWYNLPTTDPGNGGNYKERYGIPGTELVFRSITQYMGDYQSSNKSFFDEINIEVQGAWTDLEGGYTSGTTFRGFYSVKISSIINGKRDPDAYHYGNIGSGFIYQRQYNGIPLNMQNQNSVIDGIEVVSYGSGDIISGTETLTILNTIISTTNTGVTQGAGSSKDLILGNCIIHGVTKGIDLESYAGVSFIYNTLVFNCEEGVEGSNHNPGFVINTVCLDCTTNWSTPPTDGVFANNAGEAGDAIWASAGQSSTLITAADFMNYEQIPTTASNYMPNGDSVTHIGNSALIEAGHRQFPADMVPEDIRLKARPRYKDGQAAEWDIGPIEFDWGYGDEPVVYTLMLQGIIEGSEVRIYDNDGASNNYGTELSGIETLAGNAFQYTHPGTINSIAIQVMKVGYVEVLLYSTITSSDLTIDIAQKLDTNL